MPLMLVGDFNSRTGTLNDLIEIEENVAIESGIKLVDNHFINTKYDLTVLSS